MAENDFNLPRLRALVHQRRRVVRVRERLRTSTLEELRVVRRLARLHTVEMSPAAELVRLERLAPALARHHRTVSAVGPEVERRRTRVEEVRPAPHHRTYALPFVWGHRHGQVEAVDEAHGVGREVGVAVVEVQLDEGGRRGAAQAVALQAAAAVAGGAGEVAVGVRAAGSGPDSAGPVGGRRGERAVSEGVEGEAAALENGVAGVGLDCRPDGEGTVVDESESEIGGFRH